MLCSMTFQRMIRIKNVIESNFKASDVYMMSAHVRKQTDSIHGNVNSQRRFERVSDGCRSCIFQTLTGSSFAFIIRISSSKVDGDSDVASVQGSHARLFRDMRPCSVLSSAFCSHRG